VVLAGQNFKYMGCLKVIMKFTDKYISQTEAAIANLDNKAIISDDAFAVGEVIDELINTINFRLSRL
jgi:hypothetical protein